MAKNTLAKDGKSSYDTNVIRVNLSEAIEGRLSVVPLPTNEGRTIVEARRKLHVPEAGIILRTLLL